MCMTQSTVIGQNKFSRDLKIKHLSTDQLFFNMFFIDSISQ